MKIKDKKLALQLVDIAYQAGSGNAEWSDFTKAFGAAYPDFLTVMAGYDQNIPNANVFASANVSDEALDAYHNHYHSVNVYLSKAHLWKSFPDVTFRDEILSKSEVIESEFYRDFISKQGPFYEAFAGIIFKDSSRFLAFTCNYTEKMKNEAIEATRILKVVGPHLQRAFELKRQIEGDHLKTRLLERCLERVNAAVYLLDQSGHIHFANKKGEKHLRDETVISAKNNKIKLVSKNDHDAIYKDIHLLKHYMPANSPRHIKMERPVNSPNIAFLSVLVDDMSIDHPGLFGRDKLPHKLLLFLIDPREKPIASLSLIRSIINCTDSEAKLAQSLLSGFDLQSHAQKEGIAYNTARRHLQSLFAKTETTSQVELVRQLFRSCGLLI